MSTRVRPAIPEDAEAIAALASALARVTGDPDTNFTAEAVRRDAFGVPRRFEIMVAEEEHEVIGYALFNNSYESSYAAVGVYLSDIYVAPIARRRGIGRRLVGAVARVAKNRGGSFLWWVSDQRNEEAYAFFKALDATNDQLTAHALAFETFDKLIAEEEPAPALVDEDA